MAEPLAGISVLVVDDDDDARELTEIALRQVGTTVRSASSAMEALELIKAAIPAVVVADMAMPQHDGTWLLREVRCLQSARTIPFIVSRRSPWPTTGNAYLLPDSPTTSSNPRTQTK